MSFRHDPSRRRFIATATGGLIGASLPAMAGVTARGKSVIHLFMSGGMSHLDTFAPGQGCPTAIPTNVPGISISRNLPMLAGHMEKMTIFRAMGHEMKSHGSAVEAALSFPTEWRFASPVGGDFPSEISGAIRMVEAGERFVRIELGGWDTHTDNARRTSALAATLDRGFSKLLNDLTASGKLDETLVVLSTEFGRSARTNAFGGREHEPSGYACLVAGGGMEGGRVIGETTSPQEFTDLVRRRSVGAGSIA